MNRSQGSRPSSHEWPWWVLIVAGCVIAAVGLAVNVLALIVGAILLVIGVAGRGATFLDFSIPRGRLTLKRQSLHEAVLARALAEGVDEGQALALAEYAVRGVPVDGAKITVSRSGEATAQLSESASIRFQFPRTKEVSEEVVAEELAKTETKALQDRTEKEGKRRLEALNEPLKLDDNTRRMKSGSDHITEAIEPVSAVDMLDGLDDLIVEERQWIVYGSRQVRSEDQRGKARRHHQGGQGQ